MRRLFSSARSDDEGTSPEEEQEAQVEREEEEEEEGSGGRIPQSKQQNEEEEEEEEGYGMGTFGRSAGSSGSLLSGSNSPPSSAAVGRALPDNFSQNTSNFHQLGLSPSPVPSSSRKRPRSGEGMEQAIHSTTAAQRRPQDSKGKQRQKDVDEGDRMLGSSSSGSMMTRIDPLKLDPRSYWAQGGRNDIPTASIKSHGPSREPSTSTGHHTFGEHGLAEVDSSAEHSPRDESAENAGLGPADSSSPSREPRYGVGERGGATGSGFRRIERTLTPEQEKEQQERLVRDNLLHDSRQNLSDEAKGRISQSRGMTGRREDQLQPVSPTLDPRDLARSTSRSPPAASSLTAAAAAADASTKRTSRVSPRRGTQGKRSSRASSSRQGGRPLAGSMNALPENSSGLVGPQDSTARARAASDPQSSVVTTNSVLKPTPALSGSYSRPFSFTMSPSAAAAAAATPTSLPAGSQRGTHQRVVSLPARAEPTVQDFGGAPHGTRFHIRRGQSMSGDQSTPMIRTSSVMRWDPAISTAQNLLYSSGDLGRRHSLDAMTTALTSGRPSWSTMLTNQARAQASYHLGALSALRVRFPSKGSATNKRIRYSGWIPRLHHSLLLILVYAHVPATIFLDYNALYALIQVADNPDRASNSSSAWWIATGIYTFCDLIWFVIIIVVWEFVVEYRRRWHNSESTLLTMMAKLSSGLMHPSFFRLPGRPFALPIYLSSPAFSLTAVKSYSLYSLLFRTRLSASPRDFIIESFWFYSQSKLFICGIASQRELVLKLSFFSLSMQTGQQCSHCFLAALSSPSLSCFTIQAAPLERLH